MKLILIGVGHAGNHIVDTYYRYSTETEATTVVDAMAVNTSLPDLNSLRHLDRERRVLVGQDEVDGRGVGTDIERGATLLNDDIEDVLYRLDDLNIEAADAFMVVGSLGGGTGGGGVPIICRYLNEHYDLPVLTTSILPSRSETPLHEYNAIVSLRSLVQVADSVFLFDNNQWNESSKSVAASYQEINENIVVYLSALFTAISPGASDTPGTSILDQPDFEKTIEAGRLSVLGYEDLTVRRRKRGVLSQLLRLREALVDPEDATQRVETLVHDAVIEGLSARVTLRGTGAALAIAAGPEEYLTNVGFDGASTWLREQTACRDIRIGDYPIADDSGVDQYLAALVVLSGPRVVAPLVELYESVVGVDTIAGAVHRGVAEPVEVMYHFFTNSGGPAPLFDDVDDDHIPRIAEAYNEWEAELSDDERPDDSDFAEAAAFDPLYEDEGFEGSESSSLFEGYNTASTPEVGEEGSAVSEDEAGGESADSSRDEAGAPDLDKEYYSESAQKGTIRNPNWGKPTPDQRDDDSADNDDAGVEPAGALPGDAPESDETPEVDMDVCKDAIERALTHLVDSYTGGVPRSTLLAAAGNIAPDMPEDGFRQAFDELKAEGALELTSGDEVIIPDE